MAKEIYHNQNVICWPLVIYLVITLLVLIIILTIPFLDTINKVTTLLISSFWALLWGAVLWWACRYCYWAWGCIVAVFAFLINLIFLLIVLLVIGFFDVCCSFSDINSFQEK